MLLLCSYMQNSDFPRADQSPDEMEFHVNVLAPRRATWIIRDRLCTLVIAEMSTRMPLSSGWRNTKTTLVNNAYLGRFLWEQNLVQNLDLTKDFPSKIWFPFLWVKMLPKNLPKIFRWPEMGPLCKILAQDF